MSTVTFLESSAVSSSQTNLSQSAWDPAVCPRRVRRSCGGIPPSCRRRAQQIAVLSKSCQRASRTEGIAKAEKALDEARNIDGNEKADKQERSILLNAKGNDFYAKGDYRQARVQYQSAIELSPKDAIFLANLGYALQQLKTRGQRKNELEEAIEAFSAAQELKRSEDYEKDIARLRGQLEFASQFGEQMIDAIPVVTPIAVEVAKDLVHLVDDETKEGSLSDYVSSLVTNMRSSLKERFGINLPGVSFKGNEGDLENGTVTTNQDNGNSSGIGSVNSSHRFFHRSQKDGSRENLSPPEVMISHLETVIQKNSAEFLGHQEVANLLRPRARASLNNCGLIRRILRLSQFARAWAIQGVPVRPFDKILEVFRRYYSRRTSLQDVVESIRSLPDFRSKLPGNDESHKILALGRRFEIEIRSSVYRTGAHAVLAMEPERCQRALAAVRAAFEDSPRAAVLVERQDWRPFVRSLIELEFPSVPVLSGGELEDRFRAKIAGTIELDTSEFAEAPPFWNRSRGTLGATSDNGWGNGPLEQENTAITVFVNEAFNAEKSTADDAPLEELLQLTEGRSLLRVRDHSSESARGNRRQSRQDRVSLFTQQSRISCQQRARAA